MAIAYKVSKEEHSKLNADLQGEYTLVGNEYVLDLSGGPDVKAGAKFEAERDKRRAAEKRAKEAEEKLEAQEEQYSDTAKAIKAAEKEKKKAEDELAVANKRYTDYVGVKEIDTAAAELAGKLSRQHATVLLPHVKARLSLDMTDIDNPKVVVLGDDKKPSTMTLADLEKNFRDNKDFSGIVTASQASGGGASRLGPANGHGNPAPGAPSNGNNGPVDLSTLSSAQLAQHITARRSARGQEVAS